MTHKTKLITLGILGTIAAAGAISCCLWGWFDEPGDKGGGGRGGGHHHGGRGFIPIFFGRGGGGGGAPAPAPHAGSSPRGGFGATGGHGGGVGA